VEEKNKKTEETVEETKETVEQAEEIKAEETAPQKVAAEVDEVAQEEELLEKFGNKKRRSSRRKREEVKKEAPDSEWKERVVQIRRVTKVVKGGKKLSFRATVVVGNGKGQVGLGIGKSSEVIGAIQKAITDGRKNLVTVPIFKTTIPHKITASAGAGSVVLKPASKGTGIIAGGSVRAVLELAGIENILSRRHNNVQNYKLIVPEQLLKQSEETQKIFNIVMGAIAGISLLVGGIGIMNIMLATVLERTREIGVRRSLGATQHDIRNQFLIEATILSLIGGIVGIMFGYILAYSVTIFSDWETAVSLWSIVLSFGVSSGVGVAFGYYPAKKASELNPIEALRYE